MSDDPVRLLDEGGSELLRSLISAGREEEPEVAAMRRTLAAVSAGMALNVAAAANTVGGMSGAGGAGGAGGASGAAVGAVKGASSTLFVVVKWLAIGAVTGTVASSAVYGVSSALMPPPASAAAPVQSPPVVVEPAVRAVVPVKKLPDPPPAPALATAPPPTSTAPVASRPEADPGAPLAAEVAALDSARQALRAGDAVHTLAQLDGYEQHFPEARMLPEALYLRLEAFTLKGDKSDAEAVARRILRVYPSSPHAARARSVLGLDK